MLSALSSPHTTARKTTGWVMSQVLLALVPGVIAMTWFYGWGTIINIVWMCLCACALEAVAVKLRKRSILFYLKDGSALVTAVLLALAIPPYAPWWASLIGVASAILLAKHLYGGLGYNPFNPAMVGYVILLISFPVVMTQWPVPAPLLADGLASPGFLQSISLIFELSEFQPDAYTSATALDVLKHNSGLMVDDLRSSEALFSQSSLYAVGVEWVNIGLLLGGLYLLIRRIFTWHAPVGMLLGLALLSICFYDGGSSSSEGSPIFHLLVGGTMLGAFFIVTDPVSGATSNLGRFIFGVGAGAVIFVIRAWGNYPDGIAFAVLLFNFAAPFIDYYTQPKTYGHKKRPRARMTKD